ncbi:MAG: ABC-type lipoprotein export system ATPase subunit [Rhodothermales bacterium]|jgi:ABC-type lipoprotein export system ATPase subunit
MIKPSNTEQQSDLLMSKNPIVCQVNNVSKAFGDQPVLRGVTFAVSAGERVALMGPSGSGKSTLLNCLSGIDSTDSGEIQIGGRSLNGMNGASLAEMRRGAVSTVFQFFHLLPTLSVFENIELSLQLAGVESGERQRRVSELIDAVQLSHRPDAFPETLSGGERQRVAIARALVHRPRILLADEPTGNLDSETGSAILDLLAELTELNGTALLMVTHSADAARICQRTLHLRDGQLQ